jgi:RimJ/RimL family protein N-acetyltransferase
MSLPGCSHALDHATHGAEQVATTVDADPTLPWARSRRLLLREFGPADHAAILAMHRDAQLRALLVDDYPLDDPRVAQLFIERMAGIYRRHEGLGIWHASLPGPESASPEFAGWFNLMPMAEQPGEVEIGSRLLPQVWGRGLALEGGEMLLAHAFDDLALPRVWGTCHPDNRSAIVVLHALGFEPLGERPYDGKRALFFCIGLNAWRAARNTTGATRLRRALRATKAHQHASPSTTEESPA